MESKKPAFPVPENEVEARVFEFCKSHSLQDESALAVAIRKAAAMRKAPDTQCCETKGENGESLITYRLNRSKHILLLKVMHANTKLADVQLFILQERITFAHYELRYPALNRGALFEVNTGKWSGVSLLPIVTQPIQCQLDVLRGPPFFIEGTLEPNQPVLPLEGLWPLPPEAVERRNWCLQLQKDPSRPPIQLVTGPEVLHGATYNPLSQRPEALPNGFGHQFEINWHTMTVRAIQ